MFLKQDHIFNFNVDEIEIYWTFSNHQELLKWINSSNSDYIIFEWFTLKKSDWLRDYEYKIDFWINNLPCFAFYIWKKLNDFISTRDYFKVYWSAFQVFELSWIIEFIDTYVECDSVDKKKGNKINTLKRFDLAIDLKKHISRDIVRKFKKLEQKGAKYYGAKWELETYYIWEYKKKLNSWYLIRIYDKIKDIQFKHKEELYSSYLLEDYITRIEIEFRSEVVRYVNIHNLLDRNYIFNLFIKYIAKHTKMFDRLKTEDVEKLKRLKKKINLHEIWHDKVLRDKYLKAFLWYWKNILKIWLCPTDILIRNLLVSDLTKSNIPWWIDNDIFDESKYLHQIAKSSPNPFENFFERDFWKN